jgi:hypothetical protein
MSDEILMPSWAIEHAWRGLVVHCRRDPFDVYVGRSKVASLWGNPFTWKPGTLAEFVVPKHEVLLRYATWLLGQPALVARARASLAGKRLGCWCRPSPHCHGDILAVVANSETVPR